MNTKQEQKHTATPWSTDTKLNRIDSYKGIPIFKGTAMIAKAILFDSATVRPEESQANAEFIVMSCNNHYQLVEALRKALDDLDQYQKENEEMSGHISPRTERIIAGIEQALAKAQG